MSGVLDKNAVRHGLIRSVSEDLSLAQCAGDSTTLAHDAPRHFRIPSRAFHIKCSRNFLLVRFSIAQVTVDRIALARESSYAKFAGSRDLACPKLARLLRLILDCKARAMFSSNSAKSIRPRHRGDQH